MRHSSHGRLRQQMSFLRRQFLQDGGRAFSDVLSEGIVEQATTVLNAEEVTKDDLVQRYHARGNAELDLRSLKRTLQMDVLRCKTPELVRKEIWTHILAYNLIRTIMAQAAAKHGVVPRTISFKGTVQTLEAFP
jgi:hypothetical protein